MNLSGEPKSTGTQAEEMNQLGRRVQELVEQIQSLANPAARSLLEECMESLVSFYGLGLARILEITERAESEGESVREALVHDSVVSGMLLIHDLHPLELETRLRDALEKVRPYMESHGGDVELVCLENDFAKLRLQGHCKTCASSAVTLELAVRNAIEEACPDLAGFDVEGVSEAEPPSQRTPTWTVIEANLGEGELLKVHAADTPLVLCKARGQLYAYRDRCPACNMPLHLGALAEQVISCRAGHRYDVHRAGIELDQGGLHLDPLPLLVEHGVVKVAIPE